MMHKLRVTVGPDRGDFRGRDSLTIQAALEFVAAHGGGTVELLPGHYDLLNSVRLRSGVEVIGAGAQTVLSKPASVTVPITDDTDWYEDRVSVADASGFRVGGGILLQGRCPHSGQVQVFINTVRAIVGNTLWLVHQARGGDAPAHHGNFWLGKDCTAATIFSLITANWAHDLRVANLAVDGSRDRGAALNGNYGGALYFQDCERVTIEDVRVEHIESDGLSFQVVHDLTVQNCQFLDAVQGVHAGSGSQRPVIRGNTIRGTTGNGALVWCWGVKHGLAENNTIEDCATGITIGHRDTDNVMRGNTVRRCRVAGLVYRDDPPHQAAHNTLVEANRFEDIGTPEAPGYGIDLNAPVQGTTLRGNHIVCTRPGLMKAGIRIGPKVAGLSLDGNVIEGIANAVEDLRSP
jgi:polygalacturonase